MITVDSSLSIALESSTVKLCEIYEIELSDGSFFRFADHPSDISWSNTFTRYAINRSQIRRSITGQADEVEIEIGKLTGDFKTAVVKNKLEAATVTIKVIRWNDSSYAADREIIRFHGFANISYTKDVAVLRCTGISNSLQLMFPRATYQEPCNHTLYDDFCRLTKSDYILQETTTATGGDNLTVKCSGLIVYKVAFDGGDSENPIEIGDTITDGSVTAIVVAIAYITSATGYIYYYNLSGSQYSNDDTLTGGGNTVVVDGTPEDISGAFYRLGEIKITSGDHSGQRRMIRTVASGQIKVAYEFPGEIASGITFDIYPGCDKTPETCRQHFNNEANYLGFLYIPKERSVRQ